MKGTGLRKLLQGQHTCSHTQHTHTLSLYLIRLFSTLWGGSGPVGRVALSRFSSGSHSLCHPHTHTHTHVSTTSTFKLLQPANSVLSREEGHPDSINLCLITATHMQSDTIQALPYPEHSQRAAIMLKGKGFTLPGYFKKSRSSKLDKCTQTRTSPVTGREDKQEECMKTRKTMR